MVVRRHTVDGGRPGGLDEPLGTRPALSGPAAEGQVVKVAGEPDVCWEIDRERERWVSLGLHLVGCIETEAFWDGMGVDEPGITV